MRPLLFALLVVIAGSSWSATYPCPPALNASQIGCTFVSPGGTTTFTVKGAAQLMSVNGNIGSAVVLNMTLDALPCNDNFSVQVGFTGVTGINGGCTFDVTSKRPVELVAVTQYFNATPLYIELGATSTNFVPDNFLSVATIGGGTVTSSDGGINCGSDCIESYSPATTITLNAIAANGSSFIGWSGSCSGSAPACILRMSETRTVTANFTPNLVPPIVEFYNATLDHYFITSDPEAAAIDNGIAGPGWTRTGLTFKAGGNVAVCRFYGSLSPGPNSHFYTGNIDECHLLQQLQLTISASQPRWNFEGIAFSTSLPSGGVCPSFTAPVYRAYNNGFELGKDSNHRFTTSPNALQEVVAKGWKFEGVVMCAPQ